MKEMSFWVYRTGPAWELETTGQVVSQLSESSPAGTQQLCHGWSPFVRSLGLAEWLLLSATYVVGLFVTEQWLIQTRVLCTASAPLGELEKVKLQPHPDLSIKS